VIAVASRGYFGFVLRSGLLVRTAGFRARRRWASAVVVHGCPGQTKKRLIVKLLFDIRVVKGRAAVGLAPSVQLALSAIWHDRAMRCDRAIFRRVVVAASLKTIRG
jgi:hypothetical protein